MAYFPAIFFESEGGFDFVCPDIPGFAAHGGPGFGEAAATAREVLASHLAALLDAGGEMPRPRDLAELRADPEFADDFAEAAGVVMLPAIVPAGRTLRVNLSLDENTLDLIDASARDRGLTRSAFVAAACRHFATGGGAGDRMEGEIGTSSVTPGVMRGLINALEAMAGKPIRMTETCSPLLEREPSGTRHG